MTFSVVPPLHLLTHPSLIAQSSLRYPRIILSRAFSHRAKVKLTNEGLRSTYSQFRTSPVANHPLAAIGGPFDLTKVLHPRMPLEAKSHSFSGLSVYCLGTSSGMPSPWRSTSSYAVRLGSSTTLIDAGEGAQLQLMKSVINPSEIDRICITHLHGDHIFGLPGVLLHINRGNWGDGSDDSLMAARLRQQTLEKRRVIEVFGPPGLYNYLAASLKLSGSHLNCIEVRVKEMHGCVFNRGLSALVTPGVANPWSDSLPELSFPGLVRERLYPDENGAWQLIKDIDIRDYFDQRDGEVTAEMQAFFDDSFKSTGGDFEAAISATNFKFYHMKLNSHGILSSTGHRPLRLEAAEVNHVRGIQTFGFSLSEMFCPKRINLDRAVHFGVKPGPKYQKLKASVPVRKDPVEQGGEEGDWVQPDDLFMEKVAEGASHDGRGGRKVTLLGDNRGVSQGMKNIMRRSDLLLCESTLGDNHRNSAWERGHSVPSMAVQLAIETECRGTLLLSHLSQRYNMNTDTSAEDKFDLLTGDFAHRARKILHTHNKRKKTEYEKLSMYVACDFMEVQVPNESLEVVVPADGIGAKFVEDAIANRAREREKGLRKAKEEIEPLGLSVDAKGRVFDTLLNQGPDSQGQHRHPGRNQWRQGQQRGEKRPPQGNGSS
jgi:ribonuclease BN (tRNA processing enzyme)